MLIFAIIFIRVLIIMMKIIDMKKLIVCVLFLIPVLTWASDGSNSGSEKAIEFEVSYFGINKDKASIKKLSLCSTDKKHIFSNKNINELLNLESMTKSGFYGDYTPDMLCKVLYERLIEPVFFSTCIPFVVILDNFLFNPEGHHVGFLKNNANFKLKFEFDHEELMGLLSASINSGKSIKTKIIFIEDYDKILDKVVNPIINNHIQLEKKDFIQNIKISFDLLKQKKLDREIAETLIDAFDDLVGTKNKNKTNYLLYVILAALGVGGFVLIKKGYLEIKFNPNPNK